MARAMSLYGCWAPEPDNVPPWAEYIDGYWYCNACWKWLDYKHVETGQHIKRVENWYWRQAHSAAVLAARSAAQSAEARPSAAEIAADMAVSTSVNHQDLAQLHAFLHDNQRLTAGPTSSAATAHKTAPTLPSPSPLPASLPSPQTSPPCLVAATLSAAGSGPGGSEEPREMQMSHAPTLFQISTPPQPPPPRRIPNSTPPPPPYPAASTSAAGSTQAGGEWFQQTRTRSAGQIPTTESNVGQDFSHYLLTYTEGNVRIAFMRDGQQAVTLTMPAEEATRLAAGLTTLLQLASGTVATSVYPRS